MPIGGAFGPHRPDQCTNPRCGVHHKLWPAWRSSAVDALSAPAVPPASTVGSLLTQVPPAGRVPADRTPATRAPAGRVRIPSTFYPNGHGELSHVYQKLGLSLHKPTAQAGPSSRIPAGRLRIPPTRYPGGHGEMSDVYWKLALSKHLAK